MDAVVAKRLKASLKPKAKDKPKGKKIKADAITKLYESEEGVFVREYLDEACGQVEAVAMVLGSLKKRERRVFVATMIEMCEDYATALYEDEDDDDIEDEDDDDIYGDDEDDE